VYWSSDSTPHVNLVGMSLNSTSKKTNPRFLDTTAANLHLQTASPAVNAGIEVGYTVDLGGVVVPTGGAPDIGSYEIGAQVNPTPTDEPTATVTATATSPAPTTTPTATATATAEPTLTPTAEPTATSPVPTATATTEPTATPTTTATATATASGVSEGNFVQNPGCDASTANWQAFQGKVTRVTSVSRSGGASCQVAYARGKYYMLDDLDAAVQVPKQGERYTATAWVRSDKAVGKKINLVLRLNGGGATAEVVTSPELTLSTQWQQVTVSATVDRVDRTSLDLYIVQNAAASRNSFQADDISLVLTP
jgi:hypothetical protein